MSFLSNLFNGFLSLNSSVFIAVMFFLISLVLGAGLQTSVRAGLNFGGGLVGISAVMSIAIGVMTPIAQGLSERLGTNLSVVDIGYAGFPLTWQWPGAMICFFAIFVISFVLVGLGVVNTVVTDPHNIWHGIWYGLMAYSVTGNLWLGVGIALVLLTIYIFLADHYAKELQDFNEIPNISFISETVNLTLWFSHVCMKVINLIPGLRDVKATTEDLKEKFGVFGEIVFIGFALGLILSLLAGIPFADALYNGIALGASLELFPRVSGFLLEGIVPMTTAITAFMQKRFPGRNLNITVDVAVLLGHPSIMSCFVILVPISIILNMVLPGINFIPIASLSGIPYYVGGIVPATKGNIVHTVIICTLLLVINSYVASWCADMFTAGCRTAGVYLDEIAAGQLFTCWDEGGTPIMALVKVISGFFVK